MGKVIDLTNQKFGRLTVINRGQSPNGRREAYWNCICECGNETTVSGSNLRSGAVKSCGCLQREIAANLCKNNFIDYSGQKIGKLFVKERVNNLWLCDCECGNKISVSSRYLRESPLCSCGCMSHPNIKKGSIYNLVGKKYGQLLVLEETELRENQVVVWKCQCDCGEICYASTTSLLSGRKKSCGCMKSYGELIIKNLLKENNIQYEYQKTFKNCIFPDTGKNPIFDFFLPNFNCIIEFDGIQHFQITNGWNTPEKLRKTMQSDLYKNKWCKVNNISLIRIPYTIINDIKIQDLLPVTSSYII